MMNKFPSISFAGSKSRLINGDGTHSNQRHRSVATYHQPLRQNTYHYR